MKKTLLLCAAALFSLMASAGDGLTAVGADIIVLPSSYWDGDIEWKAQTWVYNSQTNYGEWNSWNQNYNQICGTPADDSEGRMWYEPGFSLDLKYDDAGELLDKNYDVYDDENNEIPIYWEERTAPFSSDATFNNRQSYRWTTENIMADIYVRRTFTTDLMLSGPVYLACGHDDAPAEYYINGVLVFERTGWEGEHEVTDDNGTHIAYDNAWNNEEYILLTDEQKALIKLGGEENVIAFHVHQNWGGAFADCGLYTKVEGGLEMGYVTPWEGKVLFNNTGGYNRDGQSPSNNPKHPWSALYEAQEGDEYTFTMPGESDIESPWNEQLHFKTPIKIEDGHAYTFKARVLTDSLFEAGIVKLTDNDNDEIELAYEEMPFVAPEEGEDDYEGTPIEISFLGEEVNNFKIAFDFGGGKTGATVTIKDMSLIDESDDDKELWIGTHYFNFFYMAKPVTKYMIWDETLKDGEGDWREAANDEEREVADEVIEYETVNAPEMTGRVETLAWTQADFDDSMWDDQMMPTGSSGYMPEQQSIWPRGVLEATEWSSNYWIRRNFELEKINDRLSYDLNVCHDDVYETYVNGVLLQKNVGWTNGKSPVQVHIPARYLNVGKNVIATYIQQNWGGYFYDCGINVTEVNPQEAKALFDEVIAYAKTDTLLTNKMWEEVDALVAEAQQFYQENINDPAEIRNCARDLRAAINNVYSRSASVKILKDTYDICRKMEDKGYWGTALTDAAIALDTCSVSSQWTTTLENLRYARKATAMERHTENFVGCVPEAIGMESIGLLPIDDPIDEPGLPRYFIYNVGGKNFLGGGESWGTHAVLEYASNAMAVVQAERDVVDEEGNPTGDIENIEGAYYIETYRPNGNLGEHDYLGANGFVDRPMETTWEFIPVEGKPNVYNIAQYGVTIPTDTTYNVTEEGDTIDYVVTGGGKKYLGLRNGDNAYNPSYFIVDTDNKTPELETNQWMFISREELLGLISKASEDNPVDVTFLIDNPGYDQRLSIDSWVFSGGSVWGRGDNHQNFVLESYNSESFENTQDLWPKEAEQALPAGTYLLSVQGYYRDGHESEHVAKVVNNKPIAQLAYVFAGPYGFDPADELCETMPLMPIHIEANKVPGIGYSDKGLQMPGTQPGQRAACEQAGEDYFPCGLYWNKLAFTITEDDPGHIALGVNKPYDENRDDEDWIVMDNWRLVYYGNGDIDPDGIKGIESDEIKKTNASSKGIYNMLGQRLQKTQKGVNIVGGKKIIKK